jgi:hypothetical protein
MKLITLFVISASACLASVGDDLMQLANRADSLEISWKPEHEVELVGIARQKLNIKGAAQVAAFLSHLKFEEDLPREEIPVEEGVVTIPRTSCSCTGSHVIVLMHGDQVTAEFTYHHSTHIRSKTLNGGMDARFVPASRDWLKSQIDWDHDLAIIKRLRESNQSPQPTAPSRRG